MKKRHLVKRRLRFEALEARLTMSATVTLHLPVAIPAAPVAAAPSPAALLSSEKAALAFLSSEKAASPVAGKTPKFVDTNDDASWAGVEVDDLGTNINPESGGDAAQAVKATWNVPTIVPTLLSYEIVSNWVGIGGGHLSLSPSYVPSNLVQIGTYEQTYNGIPNYAAFWEVYGGHADTGGSMPLPMWISPGDQISAQVTPLGNHSYSLQITDVSKQILVTVLNQVYGLHLPPAIYTFSTTVTGETGVVTPGTSVTSAEMITAEAPNFAQYPLPSFGVVTAQAWVQTSPSTWTAFGGLPGYLVDDIISSDPNNTLGTRTFTIGVPVPGFAYIFTAFIDSN
jgi:hypothetical protein